MDQAEVALELLRRQETPGLFFALISVIVLSVVVWRLLGILVKRQEDRTETLKKMEEVAECQLRVVSTLGLIYTRLQEIEERLIRGVK